MWSTTLLVKEDFALCRSDKKAQALLAQWVRRYLTPPNAWAHMRTFWLFDRVVVDPQTNPSLLLLIASGLSVFYRALLRAWSALHGSWSQAGLVAGTGDSLTGRAAISFSCP